MKKSLLFLIAAVMLITACSCSVKNTEPKKSDSSDISSETETKEKTTMPLVIAKELFDRNLRVLQVFYSPKLDYEEEPIEGTLCPVKDGRFKTFADLEEYVNATYVKDVAENLLVERGLYKEVNGVLCIDISKLESRGYYVDWTDYNIEISGGDEKTCEFVVTGYIEEPSNEPQREPYTKVDKARNVDGNWLLEAVVY